MTSPVLAPTTPGFVSDIASHGAALAVTTGTRTLTYAELAGHVDDRARRLGPGRRLVLLAARNDLDSLITYLAALSAGHVVLLATAGTGAVDALAAAYDPDVVAQGPRLEHRRAGSAHTLHPDLALLLSTSGSTGSPKVVRLSQANLQSNADSIATALGIQATDRAATTLPLAYSYGLSVVNSHLARGASLLLTDLSVVDTCFWRLFAEQEATTFPGVPHTFELLDRVGFAHLDLPRLRYVTQAGGRLAPEKVRRFAELGQARGWDLVPMYGQTEATARMAVLPSHLVLDHPGAIGRAVPGGALHLRPVDGVDDPEVGELTYSGPNVMLGYAERPSDLALGRAVDVLATGDLARRTAEGLFEVVGRRSRFLKLYGLRIDLQQAEDVLAAAGVTATCTGDDETLVVAVEPADSGTGTDPDTVRDLVATGLGLPPGAVHVLVLAALPRHPNGKPDLGQVRRLAVASRASGALDASPATSTSPSGVPGTEAVKALYRDVLGCAQVGEADTFVTLGGDSLSYVVASIRLEELLGHLPEGWHTTPVGRLVPVASGRRRRARTVETSVALRGLAIVLIVGTHAHLLDLQGGAHVLMAVAGFNFARFQLAGRTRLERLAGQLRSVARIVLPSVAWIAALVALTGRYGPENVALLGTVLGSSDWSEQWHFWFVEVLVWVLLALAVVLAVPWVDRAQRRRPFAFAAVLVTLGLVWRYDLTGVDLFNTRPVFWLFALGWAAAVARATWQRAAVTGVTALAVPGFFGDPVREGVILLGVAALVWLPTLWCPRWLARVLGVLAAAALFVYLTHWQVYPRLDDVSPLLAVAASLVAGVAYWQLWVRAPGWVRGRLTAPGRPSVSPAPRG